MNVMGFLQPLRIDIPLLLLLLAVLASAVATIYAKHTGRTEFASLQKLERSRDHLNEDWGRLLLEQSTWASPARVEQQAKQRLRMVVPTPEMTVVIEL